MYSQPLQTRYQRTDLYGLAYSRQACRPSYKASEISLEGEIAGFALVSLDAPKEYMKLSTAEKTNLINDFFIMRKYRRRGVGKEVAFSLFNLFPGTWEVRQTHSNRNAYDFWKHVIKNYKGDGQYQEERIQNDGWNGPVFVFQAEGLENRGFKSGQGLV